MTTALPFFSDIVPKLHISLSLLVSSSNVIYERGNPVIYKVRFTILLNFEGSHSFNISQYQSGGRLKENLRHR